MARNGKKRKRRAYHLSPQQKLLLTAALLVILGLCSTVFLNFDRHQTTDPGASDGPDWPEAVTAYVRGTIDDNTAPFYNEGLAVDERFGRGSEVLLESWEPFVSESGDEYYHAYIDGRTGYFLCQNVTDDQADLLQETQLYVRSTVNLLEEFDGLGVGALAPQGTLLRIVGYDYFKEDGSVNMYHIKMGDELGWIKSEYVVTDYSDAMTHWKEEEVYQASHVFRGDAWGGGDAGGLDYWPHEKGDFVDVGNVMPEDVYALYIPAGHCTMGVVEQYLDLAKGSSINAFVITLCDGVEMAYESDWIAGYGLSAEYKPTGTAEQFAAIVKRLQDEGYYVIGRVTTFRDAPLAKARPEWSITDWYGQPMEMSDSYWPSPYCRDVWELKVGFAAEAVQLSGLNEIQFDYVRFPDYIKSYLDEGSVDTKNTLNESMAQAVQRFLTYACDYLHRMDVYVAADVFGETSNYYVAPYGQYFPAISDVVDVICGMPYPDHYDRFQRNQQWIIPYKRPYYMLYDWGQAVYTRQQECASPAITRTWIQTWSDADYTYDSPAIQRQIVALYDAGLPGGYMLWHGNGSLSVADMLTDAIKPDYRALYDESVKAGVMLSEYMGVSTDDTQ